MLTKLRQSSQRGFSFIEVVLYVAILSIVVVGMIEVSLIIKQQAFKFSVLRRVSTDAATALDNIDFLIRNSDGFAFDNSGACLDFSGSQSPSAYYLSLYFATTSSQTILPLECRG